MIYDEPLDAGAVPATDAFSVVVTPGYIATDVTSAAVNGNTVRLTLAQAVANGATVGLTYAVPATGAIRGYRRTRGGGGHVGDGDGIPVW